MKRLHILLLLSLLCAVVQAEGRYADHSVLAEGRWVKISVPKTGIFQLTDSLVQAAGFASWCTRSWPSAGISTYVV